MDGVEEEVSDDPDEEPFELLPLDDVSELPAVVDADVLDEDDLPRLSFL